MKRLLLVLIPVCGLLVGCATRIDQVTIATVRQGQPIPVTVNVTPFQTTPQAPEVFTHPAVPGSTFQSEGRLADSGPNQYAGNLAARSYGIYHFRVNVPYRIALFGVSRVATKEQTFAVDVPVGGFSFDGTGADGWRVKGIYDGGDPATQVSTCPTPLDAPAFVTIAANFPEPTAGHGGLALPLGPACFPASAAAVTSGFWAFDFISPNLENRPGWAGQTSFSFYIRSQDTLVVPGGLKFQALLKVRKPDGTETFFREIANGAIRFEPVPQDWARFTFQFAPPANSVVLGVFIRVFGVPAPRTADDAVQVDAVTPGN